MPRNGSATLVRLALLGLVLAGSAVYQLVVVSRPGAPAAAPRAGTQAPSAPSLPTPVPIDQFALPRNERQKPTGAYDLQADEAMGGHTIDRHVGKTDEELADRLRREPQISAASTYTDLETAQQTVATAIEASRPRIERWASRDGSRPNLVVNYSAARGAAIGRSLARGARKAVTATRALVVLRWHERRQRWFVLTSYPEANR